MSSSPTRPNTSFISRRVRLLGCLLALALLVAACGQGDSSENDPDPASAEDRIISNVWRTANPNVIEVGWFASSCEAFDSIDVTETAEQIDLVLKAFVDPDDCHEPGVTTIMVTLASPLGDRTVQDANLFIRDTVLVEAIRN